MGLVQVDSPQVSPEPSPEPPRRYRWVPVALALMSVVVFAVVTQGSERGAAPGSEAPTSVPPPLLTSRLADLAPGYHDELRIALAAFATDDRWLLRWHADDPAPTVKPLGDAGSVAFDVSGGFVALHLPRAENRERRLAVAAVGGRSEIVADDVSGFAWHDRQPGGLAWTTDGGSLQRADLITGRKYADTDVGPNPLRRWGDWGFALLVRGSPGEAYHFELRDPAGAIAFEDVSGYPFGAVPGGALGVTTLDGPAAGAAIALDPSAGSSERLPVEAGSFVWEAVADSSGRRLAMYENSAWLFGVEEIPLVRIAAIGGETLGSIDAASRPPAMAWSSDGRFVLAATLDIEGPQVTFFDTETGASFDVPIEFPAAKAYVMDLASAG